MLFRSWIAIFVGSVGICVLTPASAADSIQNALGASKHASQAVTMGIAASGQAVLGVAAVPLMSVGVVGGAIGAGSTAAGQAAASAAAGGIGREPLPITDQTITVTSPAEALKR